MAATTNIQDVISQMKNLINNVPEDESLRKKLYETARELSLAVESPLDSVKRISYGPLQLVVAKVACNLKIFVTLLSSTSPMSAKELSETIYADPALLERILRYLASYGMIKEAGEGIYSANHITKSLSVPGLQAGIGHHFDFHVPCYQALPKFLIDTNYRNPCDASKTPAQVAFNTDLPIFTWAHKQPELVPEFNAWMSCQHERSWLDVFPLEQLSQNPESKTPVFVDIGGGIGHQAIALKTRIPHIKRPIIVQDLAQAINHAIPFEGVKPMVHDFFTEQPIKGASFYYLRNILHDWPDKECLVLLNNIKPALSVDSAILIDEIILPNTGAHWQAAHRDLVMMTTLGAMERTERRWNTLFDSVGLMIKNVYTYDNSVRNSIMVVVLKE